jgi:hypothetical protein
VSENSKNEEERTRVSDEEDCFLYSRGKKGARIGEKEVKPIYIYMDK